MVIRYPLNVDVRGLDVLVVDDVNDSGETLAVVLRYSESFAPRAPKFLSVSFPRHVNA